MCIEEDSAAVHLANPKTSDFQLCRISLIPGLLKTVNNNKKMALPMKLFEISDVVMVCTETDTGAVNQRNIAALICGVTSTFTTLHGLVDRVMQVLGIPLDSQACGVGHRLIPTSHPSFLPALSAGVVRDGIEVGVVGVVHPSVLGKDKFDISYPCTAMELNLEKLL
jgi:phenylalanyl-tRNA synthetase beta chain